MAILFAREGADVSIVHLPQEQVDADDTTKAIKNEGRECLSIPFNLENFKKANKVVDKHVERFGKIDILVNNAAAMEPAHRLLESDPETYWRTWEVNVRGLMNMARIFLPSLLSSTSKTMLNLSSSGALSARPAGASYRCSKLAILRWTESLQLEYGGEGLLTYCVNPGSVRTELSRGIGEQARAGLRDEPGMAGDTIVWLAAERREWLGGRYVSCAWDMEELVGMEGEIVRGDKLKLRMAF